MKKIVLILLSFLLSFVACQETEPARVTVTSVVLSVTSMELEEGQSDMITATVSPFDADNKIVIWTTSDASVATVTDGLVTACKVGTAMINATTDDGGKTATCQVKVNARNVPVISVSLDRTSAEMFVSDELTLTATVNPDNASNKNVSWVSSDPSVASVTNGKVKAVSAGNATIIVNTEDGDKTATCEVMVTEAKDEGANERLEENEGNW